jgi:hypothetical protein
MVSGAGCQKSVVAIFGKDVAYDGDKPGPNAAMVRRLVLSLLLLPTERLRARLPPREPGTANILAIPQTESSISMLNLTIDVVCPATVCRTLRIYKIMILINLGTKSFLFKNAVLRESQNKF